MNNLGWLTPAPHGWKSEGADQIIDAALKVLDLLCMISGLHIHISGRRRRIKPTSSSFAEFRQRTHNQRRNRFDQVPQIQRLATLFCAVRFSSHVLRR
jgi:hypothetical protein